jgi:hypothetical protein
LFSEREQRGRRGKERERERLMHLLMLMHKNDKHLMNTGREEDGGGNTFHNRILVPK